MLRRSLSAAEPSSIRNHAIATLLKVTKLGSGSKGMTVTHVNCVSFCELKTCSTLNTFEPQLGRSYSPKMHCIHLLVIVYMDMCVYIYSQMESVCQNNVEREVSVKDRSHMFVYLLQSISHLILLNLLLLRKQICKHKNSTFNLVMSQPTNT